MRKAKKINFHDFSLKREEKEKKILRQDQFTSEKILGNDDEITYNDGQVSSMV